MKAIEKIKNGETWNGTVYGNNIYLNNEKIELSVEEKNILLAIETKNLSAYLEKFKDLFTPFYFVEAKTYAETINNILNAEIKIDWEGEKNGMHCKLYTLNETEHFAVVVEKEKAMHVNEQQYNELISKYSA